MTPAPDPGQDGQARRIERLIREGATLTDVMAREPVELGEGVTSEQVIGLVLANIELGYARDPQDGRLSMLAVEADWIVQRWAAADAESARLVARAATAEAEAARRTAEGEALRARVEALEAALKAADLKAEAGLCCFGHENTREYLKDVRKLAASVGIQGGVTEVRTALTETPHAQA